MDITYHLEMNFFQLSFEQSEFLGVAIFKFL